jgi:hypothetical protein
MRTGFQAESNDLRVPLFCGRSRAVFFVCVDESQTGGNMTETLGVNVKSSQLTDLGTGVPALVATPSTASSAGSAGQFAYDATHIYVCVATNTWVRATLATF